MKQIISFLLIVFCCSFYNSDGQGEINKKTLKKIDKVLSKLWENTVLQKEQISEIDKTSVSSLKGHERFFRLKNQEQDLVGYMILSSAPGKYDEFDLMVVFNPEDLKILGSSVLLYREEIGGEIGSPRWLRQFVGKNFSNTFKLDYEIQGISGATISVRSATKEMKRLSLLMKEITDQNLLN